MLRRRVEPSCRHRWSKPRSANRLRISIYNPAMTRSRPPGAGARHDANSFRANPSSRSRTCASVSMRARFCAAFLSKSGPATQRFFLAKAARAKRWIMKLAAGLIRPDAGRIWVMGHDIGEMHEKDLLDFRRHLGFVFQEGALFDSLTVAENVAFRLREENVAEDGNRSARARSFAFRRNGGRDREISGGAFGRNAPAGFDRARACRPPAAWCFTIRPPRGSIR